LGGLRQRRWRRLAALRYMWFDYFLVYCVDTLQCFSSLSFFRRFPRRKLRLIRPVLRAPLAKHVLRPRLMLRFVTLVLKLRRDLVPRLQRNPKLLLLLRLRCEVF